MAVYLGNLAKIFVAAMVQDTKIKAVNYAITCHEQSVIESHPDKQIVASTSKSGPVWNFDLIDFMDSSFAGASSKKNKMKYVFVLITFVLVVWQVYKGIIMAEHSPLSNWVL